MHTVIIGNGIAGTEAALTIRHREPDWDITVVSEEADHLFSRTAMMYVLCGQLSHRNIEPYERDLYERLRLHRVRGRATRIDVDARRVELAGGLEPLTYDRLVIACGSRPRPGPWPGSDLDGIGSFVALQDMEWLEREVHGGPATERPPRADEHLRATTDDSPYRGRPVVAERRGHTARTAVVVGGGLIGIEVAEIAAKAGVETHFLIMEDWYWPLAINQAESAWVAHVMEEEGVHVHLQTEVEEWLDDGQRAVRGVRTKAGDEIACDVAVVAIGVIPNTGWLADSAIDLDERFRGITVDAGLATSAPDVFAAGDCATVTWANGMVRPEQLWYTSRDQGRAVGRAALGDEVRYARSTPYNAAKFMDVEYTTAGLVGAGLDGEEEWYHEETSPERSTTRIVHQQGRVVGFNLLGRRWNHEHLVRWIDERRSLDYVLDHLQEAQYDAEFTPPLQIPGRAAPKRGLLARVFA